MHSPLVQSIKFLPLGNLKFGSLSATQYSPKKVGSHLKNGWMARFKVGIEDIGPNIIGPKEEKMPEGNLHSLSPLIKQGANLSLNFFRLLRMLLFNELPFQSSTLLALSEGRHVVRDMQQGKKNSS